MTQTAVNLIPDVISPDLELRNLVSGFSAYNDVLDKLWHKANGVHPCTTVDIAEHHGKAMWHLRRLIPLEDLREAGTFFTGDNLADEAASHFSRPITSTSIVLDPTCGAGNLLLACSRKLPVTTCLFETMNIWGNILYGWDIYPEFIETTKLRLILEGISRGCTPNGASLSQLKALLHNINHGNALQENDKYSAVTHIIMNPPYNRVTAPKQCTWGGGKINVAGVFLEHVTDKISKTAEIVAILPEVLRSGARYDAWRSMLKIKLPNHKFTIAGRFDNKTNVDVFLLNGSRQVFSSDFPTVPNVTSTGLNTVSDFFDLSVGPVVPYRDAEVGAPHPYIFPRMLPVWEEIDDISHSRCYQGRLHQPPFVVIRRTSGPRDNNRAGATLIRGNKLVAVENHLIVAVPKLRSISECRKLIKVLQHPQTTEFLNERIRCRHLTVGSISEIPWLEE